MVIEIAKKDLELQNHQNSEIYSPINLNVRRMRWGSLKSRSYDNPTDSHNQQNVLCYLKDTSQNKTSTLQQQQQLYQNSNAYLSSLERRERSMPPLNSARYYYDSDELSNKYYGNLYSGQFTNMSQQKKQLEGFPLASQGKKMLIYYFN